MEIFKDFWVVDCYYQLMLTIFKNYNIDINRILANITYNYLEKGDVISYKSYVHKPLPAICEEAGLELIYLDNVEDIVNKCIEDLKQDRLVLVYIDKYHEDISLDCYLQSHQYHAILVYDYNPEEEMFHIVENRYLNSLLYEQTTLSFNSLKKAYQSFKIEFPDVEVPLYSSLCKRKKGTSCADILSMHQQCTKENKNLTMNGLKVLSQFINRFFTHEKDILLKAVNAVIMNKKTEWNIFLQLEGVDRAQPLADIIKQWNYVRVLLMKNSEIEEIRKNLHNILLQENAWCKSLYKNI